MKATKQSLKDLWLILAIEVLTVPAVIAYFKFIEPKKMAAVVAGATFVLTGIFILLRTRKWQDGYASFTYWMIHVQLFIFSIPMFLARLAFWDREFSQIKFLRMSGPQFHEVSEIVYMLLILGAVIDIIVHTMKYKRNSAKDR